MTELNRPDVPGMVQSMTNYAVDRRDEAYTALQPTRDWQDMIYMLESLAKAVSACGLRQGDAAGAEPQPTERDREAAEFADALFDDRFEVLGGAGAVPQDRAEPQPCGEVSAVPGWGPCDREKGHDWPHTWPLIPPPVVVE